MNQKIFIKAVRRSVWTFLGKQVHTMEIRGTKDNGEFKKTTTATGTSLNKRFNE